MIAADLDGTAIGHGIRVKGLWAPGGTPQVAEVRVPITEIRHTRSKVTLVVTHDHPVPVGVARALSSSVVGFLADQPPEIQEISLLPHMECSLIDLEGPDR